MGQQWLQMGYLMRLRLFQSQTLLYGVKRLIDIWMLISHHNRSQRISLLQSAQPAFHMVQLQHSVIVDFRYNRKPRHFLGIRPF